MQLLKIETTAHGCVGMVHGGGGRNDSTLHNWVWLDSKVI
jgi:hypothetical protein